MREPYTDETPATILEDAERIPESRHEELAHALGRLLAWLLEGKKLPAIGFRVMILAYKIRPDLIGGATLDQIASMRGYGRSAAHNLSRQLEQTFGARGINDRSVSVRKIYSKIWQRKHGKKPTRRHEKRNRT